MRILFMGTPQVAAVMLKKLAAENDICGVFCQPDKPVGRKRTIISPPVKLAAQELGIEVFQPAKMRDGTAAELVRRLDPELIAVVAYGRLLPKEILEIPKHGCVNIHASLLPKYRGAAPIQYALLNDEKITGVTAMYMDVGLDTGDIIEERELEICDADDETTLFSRIGVLGAQLLCDTVRSIGSGDVTRVRQEERDATFAAPIAKEQGRFSFYEDGAREIFCKVRALCEWPCASFICKEKTIKLIKCAQGADAPAPAGTIIGTKPLTVAAKRGSIVLQRVTPEGSREMTGDEWSAGMRFKIGDVI